MKYKPKKINDQVILITGATSGIGLATAKLAASKGARVVLTARSAEGLKSCAEELRQQGHAVAIVPGDVSKQQDLLKMRDAALESFGRIDTWVNNAGVSIYGNLLDDHLEDERKLFEINYWGTRMASSIAVKELAKAGGTLINVGSELSELAPPVLGAYAASKHAIKAFTNSLRSEVELKKLPVNITLVRPTAIATPMPSHGKNHLASGEPSLPSPLYHPDVVARMILRSAVLPQRDVYVGAQSRLSALSNQFFPDFTDWFIQLRTGEFAEGISTPHDGDEENLAHKSKSGGKIKGDFNKIIFNRSLYSDLTTLGFKNSIKYYLGLDDNLI